MRSKTLSLEWELQYLVLPLIALVLFLLSAKLCFAAETQPPGQRLGLFITGLSGSHQFKTYLDQAPHKIRETLLVNGYQPDDFVWFSESGDHQKSWPREKISNRENILNFLDSEAQNTKEYDEAFVFITGHANGRDEEAMMHLPGDDVAYADLIKGIDGIHAKRMVIVVVAPQGGIWIEKLAKPGRVVIAANGYRQYDFIPMIFLRIFPAIFEKAGKPDPSGIDKQISLLEIFTDTQKRVQDWYKRNNLHCTELALIDADSDGKGESLFSPEAVQNASQAKGQVLPGAMEKAAANLDNAARLDLAMNLELPDAQMAKAIIYTVQGGQQNEY